MKGKPLGKLLFALSFCLFLHLMLISFANLQQGAPAPLPQRIQRQCALPAESEAPPDNTCGDPVRLPGRIVAAAAPPAQPVAASSGIPLNAPSYFRAAYQAFHFSDRAG